MANTQDKEPQSMAELLAQQKPLVTVRRRQVVEGTILRITPREIILDLGSKAEGIVSGRELDQHESNASLKVGDKIPVTVMQTDTDNNYIVCSLQTFSDTKKLTQLKDVFESSEPVEVRIIEERKGGFLVNYNGVRGFLPASQVALDYIGKPKEMMNKTFIVKVLEFDRDTPRLIVSQKAVVTEAQQQKRKAFFSTVKIGDAVDGIVVAVLPFGLIVNVSGVEGFVHISEIAWERVDDPKNYFKAGDAVKAIVTTLDEEEGKLTMSVKQLIESPWLKLDKLFATKQTVATTVTKKTNMGYLVRLDDGIIGMIHKTKLAENEELTEGDTIACTIESVDVEKKKVNLVPIKD